MDDAERISLVQEGFAHLATMLELVADLLGVFKALSPVSKTEEDELEGVIPYSVATDLGGTIECAVDDHLIPAAKMLKKGSQVTPEELRKDWRARRGNGEPTPT